MSRILTLQNRLHERGRIRLGQFGKGHPTKLDRLRFTSRDEGACQQIASLYGGEVRRFSPQGSNEQQWEVISDVQEIPVVIPTKMAFSQSYEQWAKGFCTRRCDGVFDVVRDCACTCNPESPECTITTRLSVILPEVPGLGVWRLETHGYYAAVELGAAIELIEAVVAKAGVAIPARLWLDQREVRRLVDRKAQVFKFVVPVLDLDRAFNQLMPERAVQLSDPHARWVHTQEELDEVAAGEPMKTFWKPVDQNALPPAPAVSVASQIEEHNKPRPKRKNAAPEIPSTGRRPRPAGDVDAGVCDLCGLPYGVDPLTKNPVSSGSRFVHVRCKEDAETPEDRPAKDGDRGGTSGGQRSSAEPAPVATLSSRRPMSHGQHAKIMALQAEAWPSSPDEVSADVDGRRRNNLLAVCRQLFNVDWESRKELSNLSGEQAAWLIEALEAIRDNNP